MTSRFRIAACFYLLALAVSAGAKEATIEELKARLATAGPEDKPGICVRLAQEQLRSMDKAYTAGDPQQAQKLLNEVVIYSQKARDAALASRRHLKNVEIAVRKLSEKLSDIKRTLAFEDQPPITDAITRLEEIRTSILAEMFKKDKK